jgi:ribosomal protein L37AE/L43A
MMWICRDCGNEVAGADAVLVTTIGWTALDGDTGRCPMCSHPGDREALHPLVASSEALERQARRAIEITKAMVERSRRR